VHLPLSVTVARGRGRKAGRVAPELLGRVRYGRTSRLLLTNAARSYASEIGPRYLAAGRSAFGDAGLWNGEVDDIISRDLLESIERLRLMGDREPR
jgi:hypothetical protein